MNRLSYAEQHVLTHIKPDGVISIEHQLEIHINDLVDVEKNPEISLNEVLAGLQYVLDYRIVGKITHLEPELMEKLARGLLIYMGIKKGKFLKQKLIPEADLAFFLFGQFFAQVEEFKYAVSTITTTDLTHALKISKRLDGCDSHEERKKVLSILLLLSNNPVISDWRDIVKDDEVDKIERLLSQYQDLCSSGDPPIREGPILPPQALYFDRRPDALLSMFNVTLENGLSTSKVEELRSYYGINELPKPQRPSILKMIWTQVTDFMIILLCIASIITASRNDMGSAISLWVVIVLNIVIGFSQELKANKALEALTSLSVPKAKVIRDGSQVEIDSADIVPGDIVILDEGEAVPADLRLVQVSQLEIVESVLTGESVSVIKNEAAIKAKSRKLPLGECKGSAFMTTVVAKGRALGVAVRTGSNTEMGKISSAITSTPNIKTPIQRKLSKLGLGLVVAAIVLCTLDVIIGIAWGKDIQKMIEVGMVLAVSVIPEGLVAVVTVAMALGVKRMAEKNAIVRKLPSVETLGSVSVICSDKTGTLTEGKMGTSELWTTDETSYTFSCSTSLNPKDGQVISNVKGHPSPIDFTAPAPHFKSAIMCMSLCNNSSVIEEKSTPEGFKALGDPTEVAMIVAAQKAGFIKESFEELKKLRENPFDSNRKLMSIALSVKGGDEHVIVFAKGAPEAIFTRCTEYLGIFEGPEHSFTSNIVEILDKGAVSMTSKHLETISQHGSQMASRGLRVLGLAMKKMTMAEYNNIGEMLPEDNFVFVGLVGLIDPPRLGVANSVQQCKKAGIKVIMITGDHIATATSIAHDLGIIDPNNPEESRAMKGEELDLLSVEAISELRPFPNVFARVSPANKLNIVKALQMKKLAVAMTGDGVNDAPAIKAADIGIAMGIGGTEITKQAADIVLADDDFRTIVAAVEEGRRVYDNIVKFIVYLLSCNSAEIFVMLLATIINLPEEPFTPLMILFANIIADVPPAMSLGLEPPEVDIMQRKPRDPNQGVLTTITTLMILAQGLVMTVLTFTVFILSEKYYGVPELAQSLSFCVLTCLQLTQAFYSRSILQSVFVTGITANRYMVLAITISFLMLLGGVYIPVFRDFLKLSYIDEVGWGIIVICLFIQLIMSELLKLAARAYDKSSAHSSQESLDTSSRKCGLFRCCFNDYGTV